MLTNEKNIFGTNVLFRKSRQRKLCENVHRLPEPKCQGGLNNYNKKS